MAIPTAMDAVVPVAKPSKPSVRFAPLDTAAMINTMIGMKNKNDHFPVLSPIQRVSAA